ncbi:MAG: cytochrome-c peroxidase [Epsilonproteobacteria bacterium]|nr:MAG: cytochrome-c peroxidase [Campylobacterota bacterium]
MNKILHPIAITFYVVILIISLPYILPEKELKVFSDDELREVALERDMASIPSNYEALLKVVDNPENPMSREKIALGKKLFFDTVLSQDKSISCASCHNLEEGGDDDISTAIGYLGQENPFHLNSPTVLNAALAKSQFWNASAKDVEEQAGGPIQAPFEMHMTPKEVEQRLNDSSEYVTKFKTLFSEDKVTFENVRKAIGAYERTLLTRGAYDTFLEGDNDAISQQAKRGMTLFITKGCKGCHTGMSVGGQSIQRFPLRSYIAEYIGLLFSSNIEIKESPFPFENKGGFLGKDDSLKFRVPILRNISKTAPYFHNGSVKELEEAVRIMSKYQIGDEFSPEEIEDMVAFLKTLDGELVEY